MAYASVARQGAMIFDDVRNAVYRKAISEHVTPESVVLDVGAGLGIHGLLAAASGARHVYLVEAEPVVRVAIEVARKNNLADRITVIEGRIEDVTLPEKVDVIVSVFTGNLLFSEDLLPSLFHARDRYLKPGGVLLPDLAELMLAPIAAPVMHAKWVGRWSRPVQGLDYSSVRRFAANEMFWLRPSEVQAHRLAMGRPLTEVNFGLADSADCHGESRFVIESTELCHGLLGWIRIRLGAYWLSTDSEEPETHWASVFMPLDEPIQLHAGEEVVVGLNRPRGCDWTWTIKARAGVRRQSSFLARMDSVDRLRRMALQTRPGLMQHGHAALLILQRMDGTLTNRQIAEQAYEAQPAAFGSVQDAMRMVQSLALRYAHIEAAD